MTVNVSFLELVIPIISRYCLDGYNLKSFLILYEVQLGLTVDTPCPSLLVWNRVGDLSAVLTRIM
jgi:hypothetical protein